MEKERVTGLFLAPLATDVFFSKIPLWFCFHPALIRSVFAFSNLFSETLFVFSLLIMAGGSGLSIT
ncbi:MAG: hypothetical protein A2W58_02345 [Candidatus Zambryskibacteria bacterium RIFCSPHIGHO2_02_38_10.5]|uniref:Uncharacterized protein n=1 Tax=Candidatus Zambryskibacteria bacterium RIFCSPHIGHO2_02_38_10.5 TaxID=1802742 RepID=A0A1G2T8S2_9BACT|nr:MAG: hypothetical protein A2W58_02345 [Candidatus Zambryskibacteria bacterium RIFCSPHIGHO2_02_38_10.5]